MPSKYRQFKEAVGMSNADSDNGKLARLKDELKTTLAKQVEKVAPIDRPIIRDIHGKALRLVKDKNLAGAEAKVTELKKRLDEVGKPKPKVMRDDADMPMLCDLEALKFDATKLDDWTLKISKCEAFIQKYTNFKYPDDRKANYSEEIAEAEAILAEGRKQLALAKLQGMTMQATFEVLKIEEPGTLTGWKLKVAKCEAFLEKFPEARAQCAEIEDVLAAARLKVTKLQAEEIYLKDLRNEGDAPLDVVEDHKLAYSGEFTEDYVAALMEKTKLSEAEILAIRVFTTDEYKTINPVVANQKDQKAYSTSDKDKKTPWLDTYVRGKNKNASEEQIEALKKKYMDSGGAHAGMIHQALLKLPKVKGTVYRGQRLTESEFKSFYGKGEVKIEAFQSQSTSLAQARDFAFFPPDPNLAKDKVICVIAEASVKDARDIRDMSALKKEEELLLLPGSVLKVVSTVKEDKSAYTMAEHPTVKSQKWYYIKLEQA